MAVTIRVMRAAGQGSTGTQDFTISGTFGGANPKGAIIISGRAATDGAAGNGADLGIGFTDGTNHAIITGESLHAQTTTDVYSFADDTGTLVRMRAGAGGGGTAAFSAFIADGIRLNWTASSTALVTVILFGGTDLTCVVGDTTQGNPSSTLTPNIRSDALLMAASGRTFIESTGASTHWVIGFAGRKSDGTITQGGIDVTSQDAQAQTEVSGVISDDSWLNLQTLNSTTIDTQAQISSITSTQFVSTLKTGTTGLAFQWMALNFNDVAHAEVKAFDPPTSGVSSAVSGLSVSPAFVSIIGSMLQAYDTGDDTGDSGAVMWSALTSTEQFAYAISEEDESDPSDSQSVSDDAAVYLDDHAGTSAFRGTLTSLDSTGWTINYSAANGTQRKWVALAVGPAAAAGSASPVLGRRIYVLP